MIVPEHKEFLQAAGLLSDVDDFIVRIFSVELLGLSAVRAAFHYIYLYHDALFFINGCLYSARFDSMAENWFTTILRGGGSAQS